jgi:hypothetical protein
LRFARQARRGPDASFLAESPGRSSACFPDTGGVALADAFEEVGHLIEARLLAIAALTTVASDPAPAGPISGRAEIRLVK